MVLIAISFKTTARVFIFVLKILNIGCMRVIVARTVMMDFLYFDFLYVKQKMQPEVAGYASCRLDYSPIF
jgi:hypothetical protein